LRRLLEVRRGALVVSAVPATAEGVHALLPRRVEQVLRGRPSLVEELAHRGHRHLRPDRRREELGQAEELEEGGRGVLEPDAGLLRVRPAMLLQHLRGGLALGHASLLGWVRLVPGYPDRRLPFLVAGTA